MAGETRRGGLLAGLCVGALATVVACASHVEGEAPRLVEHDPHWLAVRLGMLPPPIGAQDAITVRIGDVDRATDLAGIDRPTSMEERQPVSDWSYAVNGLPIRDPDGGEPRLSPAAIPQFDAAMPEAWDPDAGRSGWTMLDVGWFAEAAPAGHTPHLVAVMGGEFDADRLTSALGEPDGGLWSRHPADIPAPGILSPGVWAHAGFAGDDLVVGDEAGTVRAVAERTGPRLADNPALAELADAFDEEGAYSAVLRYQRSGFPYPQGRVEDPSVVARAREAGAVVPERFTAVGLALTHDAEGPVGVLGYVQDSAAASSDNADALRELLEHGEMLIRRRPWSDLVVVEEITVEGKVVIARLRFAEDSPAALFYDTVLDDPSLSEHG